MLAKGMAPKQITKASSIVAIRENFFIVISPLIRLLGTLIVS